MEGFLEMVEPVSGSISSVILGLGTDKVRIQKQQVAIATIVNITQ